MTPKSTKRIKPVIEEIVSDEPVSTPSLSVSESDNLKADAVSSDALKEKPVEEKSVLNSDPLDLGIPIEEAKEKFHISLGFLMTIVVVAVVVAIVSGALYVYFNGVNSLKGIADATPIPTDSPSATNQPQSTPGSTPSSTSPSPSTKPSDLKVSVLNGSGKIGEAGKAKALIEKAGFKVTQTGNAPNFNFPNTVVQVKSTVSSEVTNKIKEALKASYAVTDGAALDAKSSFDIVVTVGQK